MLFGGIYMRNLRAEVENPNSTRLSPNFIQNVAETCACITKPVVIQGETILIPAYTNNQSKIKT